MTRCLVSHRKWMPALGILWLMLLCGCATYQLGNQSLYRSDIQTVYVPIAESASFRLFLGERLTEAVVREIELRTPYKVVSRPDQADSTLQVRLAEDRKEILAETINGEARDIQMDFQVQVQWINRRGQLLGSQALPLSPLLFEISEGAHFVPEGGQSMSTAQQAAIERVAQQIVGQMEVPW